MDWKEAIQACRDTDIQVCQPTGSHPGRHFYWDDHRGRLCNNNDCEAWPPIDKKFMDLPWEICPSHEETVPWAEAEQALLEGKMIRLEERPMRDGRPSEYFGYTMFMQTSTEASFKAFTPRFSDMLAHKMGGNTEPLPGHEDPVVLPLDEIVSRPKPVPYDALICAEFSIHERVSDMRTAVKPEPAQGGDV